MELSVRPLDSCQDLNQAQANTWLAGLNCSDHPPASLVQRMCHKRDCKATLYVYIWCYWHVLRGRGNRPDNPFTLMNLHSLLMRTESTHKSQQSPNRRVAFASWGLWHLDGTQFPFHQRCVFLAANSPSVSPTAPLPQTWAVSLPIQNAPAPGGVAPL